MFAGVCHGVGVDEDLWDAYDRMGLSFHQHAATVPTTPITTGRRYWPRLGRSPAGKSWTQAAARAFTFANC